MCLLFYKISTYIWKDATRNILAFATGTGNSGYFGLPVALAILGQSFLGAIVFSLLGFTLYENSLGFFIVARGKSSVRGSLLRVLKLPTIYAFLAGLLVNLSGLHPNNIDIYTSILPNFSGAYTLLGMMVIGLGMADVRQGAFDWRFISVALLAKSLVWPSITAFLILLDRHFTHFYDENVQHLLIFMSLIPLAANTVNYATLLGTHPEKAAIAVLISTVLALFYIPLILSLLQLA
jgi:predicted permease